MAGNASTSFGASRPPDPRSSAGNACAVLLCLGILLGTLIGGASAVVQTHFAPLLIFPLLLGGFLARCGSR